MKWIDAQVCTWLPALRRIGAGAGQGAKQADPTKAKRTEAQSARRSRNQSAVRWPNRIPAMAFTLILTGCSTDLDEHDHPGLSSGKALFEFHCSECHRSSGDGNFLAGVPANKGTELSSAQVISFMRGAHRENSAMPKWTSMPDAEAAKIASYLKSL